MNAKPCNPNNAIDVTAFVIIFDRFFTEQEENKLLALQAIFKEELPHFSRNTKVAIMMHDASASKQPEHTVKEAGCKLQRFETNGKISWSLNVMDNQIIVTCQFYDRWNTVWEQTNRYIQETLKLLDIQSLSVQACVLQVVDRFVEDNTAAYSICDVFDENTAYLTSKTAMAGKLWHVHQGWFEEKTKTQKILNILNLGTNDDGTGIITTIDHSLQLQFLPKPKPATQFFDPEKGYEKHFNFLHERNKEVVKSLLNETQRNAVSLT
jgi:hypothetical protein